VRDERAFEAAAEPYRRELLAHCYRILGSIHDAEDLVQETYVRAWRAYDRFEGRSSLRRWLYAIATRACLTALEQRARRPLPSGIGAPERDGGAAVAERDSSVPWLEPFPDAWLPGSSAAAADRDPAAVVAGRSGVRLAFVAALQLLSARQRAVLTLRDVLAFPAAEVAEMLGTSPAAVDSTLRRARARLAAAGPVEQELAEPVEPERRALLERYVDAFTRADADGLVRLFRHDVEVEMPPIPTWFAGREAVAALLAERVLGPGLWRLLPTRANGAAAFATYRRGPERFDAYGIQVLTLGDGAIARIRAFNDPSLVPLFGLPAVLPPGGG
jgi:RNA polymerase sigma-70 factor (ECF subfamily)